MFFIPLLICLGALLFVATVLFPAWIALRQRSIPLGLAAGAVAVVWAYLYVSKFALPKRQEQVRTQWEAGAVEACKRESMALPTRVLGRSLLVDAAGVNRIQIIQLLADRGLQYIEVKPYLQAGKPPYIAMPGELGAWQLPGPASPYFRLRLGDRSDPHCKSGFDWHNALRMPPFLPDTCLSVEPIEDASSELAIVLERAADQKLGEYGAVSLVRRETQEVLARLTTFEAATHSVFETGDQLSKTPRAAEALNHRRPRAMLVDLVHSPDPEAQGRSERVLKVQVVTSRLSLDEVLARSDQLPLIQVAAESHVFLNAREASDLFSLKVSPEGWAATVEEARRSASPTTPYGPDLLDLGSRTLMRLEHQWPYPWKTHAVLNGFFVVSDHLGWDKSPRNLLVRFRADGEFEWAVAIAPPTTQSNDAMNWPQALFVEGGNLVFAARGRQVTPEDSPPSGAKTRSPRWKVPLASLPSMAPLPTSK